MAQPPPGWPPGYRHTNPNYQRNPNQQQYQQNVPPQQQGYNTAPVPYARPVQRQQQRSNSPLSATNPFARPPVQQHNQHIPMARPHTAPAPQQGTNPFRRAPAVPNTQPVQQIQTPPYSHQPTRLSPAAVDYRHQQAQRPQKAAPVRPASKPAFEHRHAPPVPQESGPPPVEIIRPQTPTGNQSGYSNDNTSGDPSGYNSSTESDISEESTEEEANVSQETASKNVAGPYRAPSRPGRKPLSLYSTSDSFIIYNHDKPTLDPLVIGKNNSHPGDFSSFKATKDKKTSFPKQVSNFDCFGILGIIALEQESFLVVITDCSPVGLVNGKRVYVQTYARHKSTICQASEVLLFWQSILLI